MRENERERERVCAGRGGRGKCANEVWSRASAFNRAVLGYVRERGKEPFVHSEAAAGQTSVPTSTGVPSGAMTLHSSPGFLPAGTVTRTVRGARPPAAALPIRLTPS